eukprot:1141927-Prorocentrum_minimum.AAC.4
MKENAEKRIGVPIPKMRAQGFDQGDSPSRGHVDRIAPGLWRCREGAVTLLAVSPTRHLRTAHRQSPGCADALKILHCFSALGDADLHPRHL